MDSRRKSLGTAAWLWVTLLALGPSGAGATGLDALPAHSCVAPDRPQQGDLRVTLDPVVQGFPGTFMPAMVQDPTDPTVRYALHRSGLVRRIAGCCSFTNALDISSQVYSRSEGGLLGIALDPSFATNGEIYLYYTHPGVDPELDPPLIVTTVSRFTTLDGGLTFSGEQVLFSVEQPRTIHNAGDIHFGPDGYLYIGLGDGGISVNAQDTSNVFGSMLRIDVHGGSPYVIPPDNPFAAGGGAPEIFAWGLRNPYRWGFDPENGLLWAGDAGQARREEVNIVMKGHNYGWPILEGELCFSGDCSTPGLAAPAIVYSHNEGCAIIGGRVYRGSSVPELDGAYIYGDFCSGQIWAALWDDARFEITPIAIAPGLLAGFAQDDDGEVLALAGNAAYRFIPDTSEPTPFPEKLSETGCVDPANPSQPVAGALPYSVNQILWSDDAVKTRWLTLPAGETIDTSTVDGDLELPIGSVTVKTFFLDDEAVETRLFLRHDDGGWAGYSYEWDADGLDATLLEDGKTKQIGSQTWTYPSRAQCLQCHTFKAGYTLGLEQRQLNGPYFYAATGRTANQLATFDHLGLLDPPLATHPGALPALRGDSLNEAARGYLHVNCSGCHRDDGGAGTEQELHYDVPFDEMFVCNRNGNAGNLGVVGAKTLKPGNPSLSIMSLRMHALAEFRMPPVGRSLVDPTGTALIDDWITSWIDCSEGPDSDGDGIGDATDNCVNVANPDQADFMGNGIGDVCRFPCHDGADNDGDGFVDYPEDPGCNSALSGNEEPECQDGIDNDGDGAIDSPFDLGCESPNDGTELSTCEDGIDNDQDGTLDWDGAGTGQPDPTCGARPFNAEPDLVPEPGSASGLAAGLALLAGLRRRRATACRAVRSS